MERLRLALDTGPLHGPRTGVGAATAALRTALAERVDVALAEYIISTRARPRPGEIRLPLPAAAAHRCWAHVDHPRVDRWLGDVDVVIGTNYVVPPSRHPRVVMAYDVWFLRHPDAVSRTVRRAGRILDRSAQSGAVIVTSSRATAVAARELLPGADVRTIHLGAPHIPEPSERPPIAELAERPFVLVLGTIERRKNVTALVRAFGAIAAESPDLLLVIAGSPGDDAQAVDDEIDALGPTHAPRVLRTGHVDDATRGWLLHHAHALAYPSLDEGFGFPLLEAMQVGLPIVASSSGSIPEVAGDAARYCDPLDTDSIAEALTDVVADDDLRARLIASGAARWPAFTWERCADELIALCREVSSR